MPRYMVIDFEVENHDENKRFASPFCDLNYRVADGWKLQGDDKCSYEYHTAWHRKAFHIPDDVTLLVGLNIKFDLLYIWNSPALSAFLKRGGKIWCCQYAEYLLRGQEQSSQMVSMEDIAPSYGGSKKLDEVKTMWEAGYLTSQIDRDLLIDYLVGTEKEGRNAGDIGNTEKIFLGQMSLAKERNMVHTIMARMDGLLCTTEMEYNGLKIDVKTAVQLATALESELEEIRERINSYLPKDIPAELEFNWASPVHASCMIFGGTVRYQKQDRYIDPSTGLYARLKATGRWPLFNGSPVDPATCEIAFDVGKCPDYQNPYPIYCLTDNGGATWQDKFVSGKRTGEYKYLNVHIQGKFKTKYQNFFYEFRGFTNPSPTWKGANTDGKGGPLYSVSSDVIEELGNRNIPFLKDLAKLKKLEKDLGTYYIRIDKGKTNGMLTCVRKDDHIVHHKLNHASTVTSRLSSSDPNLQNIPRGDTSDVKKMFISRFENGLMLEADYSQLEVVVQGLLSKDVNLCRDLNAKVDFHCKRVAAWKGCTYDEAKLWCKDETHPNYREWKVYRTNAKVFSFQRAYGAGAAKISDYTGMPIEDVKDLIVAEEIMYPDVQRFNKSVEEAVLKSAVVKRDFAAGRNFRQGQWVSPTGTRYTFQSHEALDWQKDKGVDDSFMPTQLKNYPIQGTGGELVQLVLGKLFREFVKTDNFGGKALLCNTVHDCIWIDLHEDMVDTVAPIVKQIMESIPDLLKEIYKMDCPVPFPVEVEIGKNLFDKTVVHI